MEVYARCIGIERLDELLKRSEERLADMRGFWRSAGLYLVKRSVNDSFGKEQSPDGTKWASWTQKYKERMEKLGKISRTATYRLVPISAWPSKTAWSSYG